MYSVLWLIDKRNYYSMFLFKKEHKKRPAFTGRFVNDCLF